MDVHHPALVDQAELRELTGDEFVRAQPHAVYEVGDERRTSKPIICSAGQSRLATALHPADSAVA